MFKDYNMNQLVLPLDLEMKLQQNDIAFQVHQLLESIPQEAFELFIILALRKQIPLSYDLKLVMSQPLHSYPLNHTQYKIV